MEIGRLITLGVACSTVLISLALGMTPLAAQTRPFTDSAGREVQVPAAVNRVMAAGPPATVLLYTLAPDKLIGWVQSFEPDQTALLAEPYRSLPRHGRITGSDNRPDAAAIRALKPDIILDTGDIGPRYVALANDVQAATGIPYVLLDGRVADSATIYRQLGSLLGEPRRAETLARAAERILGDLRGKIAAVPKDRRPRVFYAQGPDGLDIQHNAASSREILDLVGAINVAASALHRNPPSITLEDLRASAPDVIVALDAHFQRTVLSERTWREIDAVRNGRVYLSPRAPFGWLDSPPGVNRLMGVQWLGDLFHGAMTGADPRTATRDFYALFYHINLTDSQLDGLLPAAPRQPSGDHR